MHNSGRGGEGGGGRGGGGRTWGYGKSIDGVTLYIGSLS